MGWRNITEWGFGPDNETKRAGRMRIEIDSLVVPPSDSERSVCIHGVRTENFWCAMRESSRGDQVRAESVRWGWREQRITIRINNR